MENRFKSSKEQYSSAPSCVACKITRGAFPASKASCQRGAHKHHRSPGFNPVKPNSGKGVERSFSLCLENCRNSSVIETHTVWLPTSLGPVSQQPLRKNPVIGALEQDCSDSPNTLRDGRRPDPKFLGSMDTGSSLQPQKGATVWIAGLRLARVGQWIEVRKALSDMLLFAKLPLLESTMANGAAIRQIWITSTPPLKIILTESLSRPVNLQCNSVISTANADLASGESVPSAVQGPPAFSFPLQSAERAQPLDGYGGVISSVPHRPMSL
jgi:hypothetical protein